MCLFRLRILGSHRRLRTPSDTFANFHRWIHMSDQEYNLGISPLGGGGICPILLHPNTRDLLLLLIYTIVSLNFRRCPISELTTHSPRMVNDQYHALTPDSTQCDHTYEMQSCHFMLCHATCTIRVTCNISKTWIIIFSAYNLHLSK